MLSFAIQGVIFIVNSYYSLKEVKHVNIQTTGMPAASSTKSHFDLLFLLILSCPICLQSHTVLSVITVLAFKVLIFLSHVYSVKETYELNDKFKKNFKKSKGLIYLLLYF